MNQKYINDQLKQRVITGLESEHGMSHSNRIHRGVNRLATLWQKSDGEEKEFHQFCMDHFIAAEEELNMVFNRISRYLEVLDGNMNQISLGLREILDLDKGNISDIDMLFGSYLPDSHLNEDFFKNKIAFYINLNFPLHSLNEKSSQGLKWTDREWAMARLGEKFTGRVPSSIWQEYNKHLTMADAYIAGYNISMGNLVNNNKRSVFPKDLKLISHWGLRDEIKAQYQNNSEGLEKQEIIYQVMKRIISQEIPEKIIDNDQIQWNPISNTLYENDKEIEYTAEPDTRYQHLLEHFKVNRKIDGFYPDYPTYIQRVFEVNMEIPEEVIKEMFINLLSSSEVSKVASVIEKRLGRRLRAFDIWYPGFKSGMNAKAHKLDRIVRQNYPDKESFERELPVILKKLGFSKKDAAFIASKVTVDPARGAGHAWGAEMQGNQSHLRTRINEKGMDYKAYNIAIHEFGHNVEQTLSLYRVNEYLMHGIPNTAFTEALAFIFQHRDIELLGIEKVSQNVSDELALDVFWSCYEIMGVSLVDMKVWNWLYDHPDATAEELKAAVMTYAKEIWNTYYAPVFGTKDEILLAVYSHMISYPLYLPAYPLGHIIMYQLENHLDNKDFASEIIRVFSQGRYTPDIWMKKSTGTGISIEPLLEAVRKAIN